MPRIAVPEIAVRTIAIASLQRVVLLRRVSISLDHVVREPDLWVHGSRKSPRSARIDA
jgi:hypothetical protein